MWVAFDAIWLKQKKYLFDDNWVLKFEHVNKKMSEVNLRKPKITIRMCRLIDVH